MDEPSITENKLAIYYDGREKKDALVAVHPQGGWLLVGCLLQ
jgi:hypothetical protein